MEKTLTIRSSPHLGSAHSVETIMFNVVLALLPVCGFAVYVFGVAALLVIVTATMSCALTEFLLCRVARQRQTVGDWSAVITGLLYGLVLPPSLALWMVAIGGVFAIGIGKFLFGGLGANPFNPALIGRAFLQAAFPTAMTYWPKMPGGVEGGLPSSSLALPFMQPSYDVVSGATPLADWKFNRGDTETMELVLGVTSGSTGETCALLILVGGVYLSLRGMMNWRIPAAVLLTVAAFSGLLFISDASRFASPMFMLFSGGLMLGAVFMATDMVASPVTHAGCVVYGVLIGLLVVIIRTWGGMPEGVMYAILLGNAASPHIDHWIHPRTFGARRSGVAG